MCISIFVSLFFTVTIARAIELKHNATLIAALAFETANFYQKAGQYPYTEELKPRYSRSGLRVSISLYRPHAEHLGTRVQQQVEEVSSAEAAFLHGLCKFTVQL